MKVALRRDSFLAKYVLTMHIYIYIYTNYVILLYYIILEYIIFKLNGTLTFEHKGILVW